MSGFQESPMLEGAQVARVFTGTKKKSWSRQHANETDLLGLRFGKLIVIKFFGKHTKRWSWLCRCDCGNEIVVHRDSLIAGNTKSCGCLLKETLIKHGMYKSPEFKTWIRIKSRCYDRNLPCYVNYGGRGIIVCNRWLESFNNFYEDMGNRPSSKHSIERKDNNGNYDPDNCKWATKTEQQRNQRCRSDSSLGVRGVRQISWMRKFVRVYSYQVRIKADGKVKQVGCFKTLEDAAKARREAEIKYWGK